MGITTRNAYVLELVVGHLEQDQPAAPTIH